MSNNILAITARGAFCETSESFPEFALAHSSDFVLCLGDKATILDQRLISYGTKGKVVGFDRSSKGNFIVMVKWHKDAAPLRVKIQALMPKPPKKFWMVIPYRDGQTRQTDYLDGSSRRNGSAPAVTRFTSRENAEAYIARERVATRFHDYMILESVQFHQGDVVIPM